ncbi:sensor histidine kinase [Tumidithrix helvetica]|uniref:sensor histidine kinase n=1 Tax=Tumidithrix helvetica TaxID=3457545 RepID=UPI003CC64758
MPFLQTTKTRISIPLEPPIAQAKEMELQQKHLISNISHELRTPLTLIYGYMQSVLRRGDNLTAQQQEALKIAIAEMEQTIGLLKKMLDAARASDGIEPPHMEALLVKAEVDKAIKTIQTQHTRTIQIQPESLLEFEAIAADRYQLQQILIELMENAIRYSPPDTPIVIKLNKIADRMAIGICDQGCGIPDEEHSQIFELFYRVDRSRARTTGGAGIGLAIAKELTEAMGGTIGLQSQQGKGSTFTVMFPISSAS